MMASKQFVISRSRFPAPVDWCTVPVGDFYLYHAPDLPVSSITMGGRSSWTIGWVVGEHNLGCADAPGRWAVLNDAELHLDPLGSYSVVYSKQLGMVASSSAVFPQGSLEPRASLNSELGLPLRDMWYPFGLTPHANVTRLLPNHCLDLKTLTARRIQPPPAKFVDDEACADMVAANLKRVFGALSAKSVVVQGLTAGNETRMMLAAAREGIEKCEYFTVALPGAQRDVQRAKILSERFGLRHTVETLVRDGSAESDWFWRIGGCVAGGAMYNAAAKIKLASGKILSKGVGGEVGRAKYFRPGDVNLQSTILAPEDVVARLHLPLHPEILGEAAVWLGHLPGSATRYEVLEALFIENRLGCWAAPQLHGDVNPTLCIWPFNQRSTLSALSALSEHAKLTNSITRLVLARLWPELEEVPIN